MSATKKKAFPVAASVAMAEEAAAAAAGESAAAPPAHALAGAVLARQALEAGTVDVLARWLG